MKCFQKQLNQFIAEKGLSGPMYHIPSPSPKAAFCGTKSNFGIMYWIRKLNRLQTLSSFLGMCYIKIIGYLGLE